jgi:glucokinase
VIAFAAMVDDETGTVLSVNKVSVWGVPTEQGYGQILKIKKVKFLNDFIANSYGIADLKDEVLFSLYRPLT